MFCLLFVLLCSSTSAQSTYYVKPANDSGHRCLNRSCLTVDQYVQQTGYFTTGATFVFLAGDHHLQNSIRMKDVSEITLRAENITGHYNIICKNGVTILCQNVSSLLIYGLRFQLHSSNDINQNSHALKLCNSNEIKLSHLNFLGNRDLLSAAYSSGAIYAEHSFDVFIVSSIFEWNTGHSGGAIMSTESTIKLTGSAFVSNVARHSGGAIFASSSTLILDESLGNMFLNNSARFSDGGAVACEDSVLKVTNGVIFTGINETEYYVAPNSTLFSKNRARYGGGIFLHGSIAELGGTVIEFLDNVAAIRGGGMCAYSHVEHRSKSSVVTNTTQLKFTGNAASSSGGAVFTQKSLLVMGQFNNTAIFSYNSAHADGVAICSEFSTVKIGGSSIFADNAVRGKLSHGGALSIIDGNLSLCNEAFFHNNSAKSYGGAISFIASDAVFDGGEFHFHNNSAVNGGGIYSRLSQLTVYAANKTVFAENSRSALCISDGNVTFQGNTKISHNYGKFGGGLCLVNSWVSFTGSTEFSSNCALYGGAVNSLYGKLFVSGIASFMQNKAKRYGGALYALGTIVTLQGEVSIGFNSAQSGGGLYLKSSATLALQPVTAINMTSNHVLQNGGAIYHEDTMTPIQCNYSTSWNEIIEINEEEINTLPKCFIVLNIFMYLEIAVYSYNNTACKGGSFLYGGLLDRCRLTIMDINIIPFKVLKEDVFHIEDGKENISSDPYILSFCDNGFSQMKNVSIYRGQTITVSMVAITLGGIPTSTLVTAKVGQNTGLKFWGPQMLSNHCTDISYNVYSTAANEKVEKITLYPDGPCRDTGLATAKLHVTLLPCPHAFTKSGERCVCEERLQKYTSSCLIDKKIHISRRDDSKFWMDLWFVNGSYQGLILCSNCPSDYCVKRRIEITLDDLDVQCANNRSGMLCGACATNHSLMLGSSRCKECSNIHLALLLPFAAAGITLVVFLSILRLTVATGMINSIILYANIVQANRSLLIPTSTRSIFTAFIAWLNLDFGFETCFYNGMTTYQLTWLQFAFPLYVWLLISLIVFTSRYSIIISKLIGHNPIAVFATLLLMSYAKILKLIIEVYSSVNLEYPSNRTVRVWLKDANIPYLQTWHLLLTFVTTLVLTLFFFPYTVLLLLGYKLYRKRKLYWLTNKLKPFLDSYYAPYKIHTRYWTGFLLLIRCTLYIVFSYNSLGAANRSLLAIIATFTTLVVIAWLSVRIYNDWYTNVIEASVYLNLIVLSAASATSANSAALVNSLIGMVFVTMTGIIMYHFHLQFIHRSPVWLKTRAGILAFMHQLATLTTRKRTAHRPAAKNSSQHPHKTVSETVIELREPLLETTIL